MNDQTKAADSESPHADAADLGQPAELAAADAATAGKSPRPGRGALIVASLALSVGLAAAAGLGLLWRQQRLALAAFERTDSDIKLETGKLGEGIATLQSRLAALDVGSEAERAALDELAARLDLLPRRFAELERRLAAVQGGSADARATWLRAEAEYFLELANAEIALGGRWETAIAALEIADQKLRELADPALAPVRALLADELIALRGLSLPDIEGTVFTLRRLADRAAELPLRGVGPSDYAAARPALDEVESGPGRLWLGFKSALGSIVSVKRRDEPVAPVLSAEEQRLVRRQLGLELEMAQVAVVRGDAAIFDASLAAARRLLATDFDAGASEVQAAIDWLDGMAEFDIAPPMPDISGSLSRLRELAARNN